MIFYFSATGNTKWAASKLADATKEELIVISDVITSDCHFYLKHNERVGFLFPVHGWRVPVIVRKFIKKLFLIKDGDWNEKPFTYSVCTAGDDIGYTIDNYLINSIRQNESLKALHITDIDSAYSLIMPEAYVGLPFMDVDNKEKEESKINNSCKQLNTICEDISNRKCGVYKLNRGSFPWIKSKVIGAVFEDFLITDKPFHIISSRCIKCGICAKVCPVSNITFENGKEPYWNHSDNCLTCFNCYHHCPHHAIEYGNRTKHKGQYYFKENKITLD